MAKGAVKTTVKAGLTLVLGIALLALFFINAVPTIFGNTTFAIWVGGTDYAWVITIMVFIMFIGSLLKTLDVI